MSATIPGQRINVATDVINNEHHQKTKLEFGADGSATSVSATDPLPVRPDTGIGTGRTFSIPITTQSAELLGAHARTYFMIDNPSTFAWLYVRYGTAPASATPGEYSFKVPPLTLYEPLRGDLPVAMQVAASANDGSIAGSGTEIL